MVLNEILYLYEVHEKNHLEDKKETEPEAIKEDYAVVKI